MHITSDKTDGVALSLVIAICLITSQCTVKMILTCYFNIKILHTGLIYLIKFCNI